MSGWSENVESLQKKQGGRQNIEIVTEFVI